jgi:hypothetical protein
MEEGEILGKVSRMKFALSGHLTFQSTVGENFDVGVVFCAGGALRPPSAAGSAAAPLLGPLRG